MPEIEPYLADDAVTRVSPPSPGTALFWDGTHWHVPRVDDHGRVQVRGEDQHFSIECVVGERTDPVISGADGYGDSAVVPAGRYWVITNVAAMDVTTATTIHVFEIFHNGAGFVFQENRAAFAAAQISLWHGHVYLDAGDTIRVYFTGGLIADTTRIYVTGYQMTIET